VAHGVSRSRKWVDSALKCRPRFIVIRDVDRDDAVLREVALLVDVVLDNKKGGTQQHMGGQTNAATTIGWRGCRLS